jgi:hypothetical protein
MSPRIYVEGDPQSLRDLVRLLHQNGELYSWDDRGQEPPDGEALIILPDGHQRQVLVEGGRVVRLL